MNFSFLHKILLPFALLCSAPLAGEDLRTFFVTRSLGHEKLLPYLREARPQIVQIGNYGAMFHGYANHPKSTGWPMQLPVSGEKAALEFQRNLNAEVHKLGLKVVGHFRVTKVMGDWEGQSGFVEYYNQHWPEDLLGKKPHPDVKELLQRDAKGNPIQSGRYGSAQLMLCLSSPYTREMLKRMLKVAVDNGVDGVNTLYNYHSNCACTHCQKSFQAWLRKKGKAAQFPPIPAKIPGYPDTDTATELDWLAMEWAAWNFKQGFDEIFVDYGRKLKPGLLLAQWNHLGHVGIGEERMFLPLPGWNQGEDYFWYSGGASFVGKNLNLQEGKAGDAWLSCLYVRELAGGKPFVMGKYDRVRLAVSMAEGYATGGMGMGRYMRFEDPAGYTVLSRYTKYMHKNRQLYDRSEPYADIGLVLPRQSVWAGNRESLDSFREIGQKLLEKQVLLDVIADENLTIERLSKYPAVLLPGSLFLYDTQIQSLRAYASNGGRVLTVGKPQEEFIHSIQEPACILGLPGLSKVKAPWSVCATAYAKPNQLLIHLVNYNRDEGEPGKKAKGPEDENPIPEEGIQVQLRLPKGKHGKSVVFHAPDRREGVEIPFQVVCGQVHFSVSKLRVYGVLQVELE